MPRDGEKRAEAGQRAAGCATGLASHRSIENSPMPSAPHGTVRALIRPRRFRLHTKEPSAIPIEKTVRNRVTTASSPPRISAHSPGIATGRPHLRARTTKSRASSGTEPFP